MIKQNKWKENISYFKFLVSLCIELLFNKSVRSNIVKAITEDIFPQFFFQYLKD